jgi:hypothetical protein
VDFDFVEDLVAVTAALFVVIDQFIQELSLLPLGHIQAHNEHENLLNSEHLNSLPIEEIVDVDDIPAKEIESLRVIVLDGLRHIDHMDLVMVV